MYFQIIIKIYFKKVTLCKTIKSLNCKKKNTFTIYIQNKNELYQFIFSNGLYPFFFYLFSSIF